MSLETRLAWRNVWRNPRRTGLCVAATVFAVYLVVLSVAMGAGTHEKMIEDGVRLHTGHVTIAGAGWIESRTLEQFVPFDEQIEAVLGSTPGLRGWAPRVTSFALLSQGEASHGAAVVGVDPRREGDVTTLPERVQEGRFLQADAHREIVLGARLAESLGAGIGDEILVYGIAYSLETAYELFTVVGLVRLPEPDLERILSVVTLADAQEFFVYGERLTEIALLAESSDHAPGLRDALEAKLAGLGLPESGPGSVSVHLWNELMPELEQFIVLDDAGMYLTLAILVVVVGFGILNTILMAILERTREFGMMMALGLRRRSVFRLVYLESLLLAGIGLVIGLALALPTVLYLAANPIPLSGDIAGATEFLGMEPVVTLRLKPLNPIGSTLLILLVGALAAVYPARKASRGQPVESLRTLG